MVIATVMMCATTYQIGNPDVPQRFQPGDVAMNSEFSFFRILRLPLITGLRLTFSLASLPSVILFSSKMLDTDNRV